MIKVLQIPIIMITLAIIFIGMFIFVKFTRNTIKENVITEIIIANASSRSLDEHIVAEVCIPVSKREKIEVNIPGPNSTGYFDLKINATFLFYISWDKFNIKIKDDTCYLHFKEPILHTPITYEIVSYETTRGLIVSVNDINNFFSEYTKTKLPKILEDEGNTENVRFIANSRAKESVEQIFRSRILPMLNIDSNKIKYFIVSFNNADIDTREKIELLEINQES